MVNINYNHSSKQKGIKKFKPVEIFIFFDPLSDSYWDIEPIIKRLHLEYGHYFSLRNIFINEYSLHEEAVDKTISLFTHTKDKPYTKNSNFSYSLVFTALKTAELQGRGAGHSFLRKIQTHLFLKNKTIYEMDTIYRLVKDANLDVAEFMKDFNSYQLLKSIHSDVRLKRDMHVGIIPSLVLFNRDDRTEGIQTTSFTSYDSYVDILEELVDTELTKKPIPSLDALLHQYQFLSIKELAFLFDISLSEAQFLLKKKMLKGELCMIQYEQEIFGYACT